VQHVDARLYVPLDAVDLLDKISEALQVLGAGALAEMISAYELINDGFAHLTPDDRPLA
jgi:hypothetical protein